MEDFPPIPAKGDADETSEPSPPAGDALERLSVLNKIRTTSTVVNAFKVDTESEREVVFTDRVIPLRFAADVNDNYVVTQKLFGLSKQATDSVNVGDILTSLNGQSVVGVSTKEVARSIGMMPRPLKVGFSSEVKVSSRLAVQTKAVDVHVHGPSESVIKSPSKQALRVKFTQRPLGISITRSYNRWAMAEVGAVNEDVIRKQQVHQLPRKGDLILAVDSLDVSQLDIQEIAALISRSFLPFVIKFKRPSNLATVELRESFPIMSEYFDLKKQSGPLVARRRFFFVVEHDRLEYYRSEREYRDAAHRDERVVKRFNLKQIETVGAPHGTQSPAIASPARPRALSSATPTKKGLIKQRKNDTVLIILKGG